MTPASTEPDAPVDPEITVLHIDDNESQCKLLADFLATLNDRISVVTTTDPTSALDRIGNDGIDCVVSDYQMPEMNGIEVLQAVRERYPNLPFFLLTGKGSEEVATEAIDAGVTSYVQKGGTEVYEQLENRITTAMERLASERLAQVNRDRLLTLYENTDGFYIIDRDWKIRYWNDRISERIGLEGSEVLGREFWDVFPEARDTELYDHFTTAMEEGSGVEFEIEYEPHEYWAEVRVHPVDDGLFVHSRDITNKKERQEELERRNEILQSFAHTVSHDLRNPLSVAEGNLRLAQETGDFDHLEEVAQAHNRMRNLIDELLRLARGEELDAEAVSIQTIAQDAWETVTSGETELIFEGDIGVEAASNQLQRLFENLYWNAIEHGEASTIRVGSIDDRGFFVEDDGKGIAENLRKKVFESGFSTDDESPGYGLSIVTGIVGMHGWSIEVTESDDGGARFEIKVQEE
jgi:PAS domain S-box-containing protein